MKVVPSSFPSLQRSWFVLLALVLGTHNGEAADLLAQAFRSLPAHTASIERDKLRDLQTLPNYKALEQMYSGKTFNAARKAIADLGIAQSDLQELVIAYDATGYYGLASGSFNVIKAQRLSAVKGWQASSVNGVEVLCSAGVSNCLAFPENSLLAFGTAEQIKGILDVRSGRGSSLRSNNSLVALLALADRDAPVMGVAPGSELKTWIGDAVPSEVMSQDSLAKALRAIDYFQYNVHFGEKVHLALNLQCKSALGANTLSGALQTMNALQAIGSKFGGAGMPFENMSSHASGSLVSLQLDTEMPAK